MRSDIRFPVLILGLVAVFAFAQDSPVPASAPTPNPPVAKPAPKGAPPAGSVYYAEQFRRLRGEIEELKGAHALQQEQSDKLKKKIKFLKKSGKILDSKCKKSYLEK